MLDSKFFFTLVGLIVAVFAICNTNMPTEINEGFWGNSGAPRKTKVIRTVHHKGRVPTAVPNDYHSMLGNDKFVSYPSFQGRLSPRFSNINYGANIRYNMPSRKNLASPESPLDMGNMVNDCYQESGIKENFHNGVKTRDEIMNSMYDSHSEPVFDSLAVGDMTTISADGTVNQPIVYDRHIFSNQKSRLRSLGCMIRGDLNIQPCGIVSVPAVNPHIDLHEGAMNVLGGISNSTSNALAELQFNTSGGTAAISGGVNMANHFSTKLGAGMADVNATAFP